MDRVTPKDRGHDPGEPLGERGKAKRFSCNAGRSALGTGATHAELWRLPANDRATAERLIAFSSEGIGGFRDGGIDDDGPWLVRWLPGERLSDRMRMRPGPWPWRTVLDICACLARALAACEEASLFAGALAPSAVTVAFAGSSADGSRVFGSSPDGSRVFGSSPDGSSREREPDRVVTCLVADRLVDALVGEPVAARASDSDARELVYLPPEHADGRPWDSAANRYALGVIIYRLLAGEHPFGGAGLRHALAEARHAEPAPFADEVARALPPGLMSAVMRMLHPDADVRPSGARQIAVELTAFLDGGPRTAPADVRVARAATVSASAKGGEGRASSPSRPADDGTPPDGRRPSRSAKKEDARQRGDERGRETKQTERAGRQPVDLSWLGRALVGDRRLRFVPLGIGGIACALALAVVLDAPRASSVAAPQVGDAARVGATDTEAGDCAACHPRHSAEWSQSVMGHAVKSPLFNALEALIEEQVGRDRDCPGGAGILRRAGSNGSVCRDAASGLAVTGSGGEHWCVNCHSPVDNLASVMPAWEGRNGGDPRTRAPVRDLLAPAALEGIACAFCHQVHGPVGPAGSAGYQGNPSWVSFVTGRVFPSRPEDGRGLFGIANSGYRLDPAELILVGAPSDPSRRAVAGDTAWAAHVRPTDEAKRYLASSEFCGSCHDVRLFGTDVLGVAQRGEHFKRLRNAYSEWAAWADTERAAGRRAATCQDCHMSTYPGVCEAGEKNGALPSQGALDRACPEGTRFVAHEPGRRVSGRVATASSTAVAISPHYFAGVDLPLAREISDAALDVGGLDAQGVPLSAKKRRDLLLGRAVRMQIGEATRRGATLEIPLDIENVGGGHKVPAGFSQERELWVHLVVQDGTGATLYEVGRVDRDDEDLRDKTFALVSTDPDRLDGLGRPIGLFGADVRDGPDVPRWSPPPELGGTRFRGKGLVNFQNGFLRCVRCIGEVSLSGECLGTGLERSRAERFVDGDYDIDTGECRSNLSGRAALLEIYFPVGSLDASRGFVKGPDAIIDTRALTPGRPVRYTYELSTLGRPGPYRVTARLMFRSFPPYLVRAFADYEAKQAARGRRPSGPLVSFDMLKRLERVEMTSTALVVP